MTTTIQIGTSTKRMLDKVKVHHRETYDELIKRIISSCINDNKEEIESLAETIEIMSDPKTMRDIAQSIEDYEKGKGTTLREFKKELEL